MLHGADRSRWHPADDERQDEADAARVATIVPQGRPYFAYLGGFDVRKRVPELVEAFGQRTRRPS